MASGKPQTRPSVRHPSHNHPLRGHNAKVEDEIICFGCNLDLTGAAYKCTKSACDYFLHKSCFELPREIRHKSHPNHPLILLHSSPNDHSTYTCNACGEYGSGFTYNCSICQYDVHVGCVSMTESMKHDEVKPCVADEVEEPCVADEEEEPCVADEEEERENEGRIRKRDIIRSVAIIACSVAGLGTLS